MAFKCDKCGKDLKHRGGHNCGFNAERFWQRAGRGEPAACWVWTGARNSWGYGTANYHQKNKNASRVAWIVTHGEIPAGMDVLHTCNNKLCCNPGHMYLGTDHENTRDRIVAGTQRGQGESHKLGLDRARAMRQLRKAGMSLKDLCAKFDVSLTIVSKVCNGHYYKDA